MTGRSKLYREVWANGGPVDEDNPLPIGGMDADGNPRVLDVNRFGDSNFTSNDIVTLLRNIEKELKKITFHLETITNLSIQNEDIVNG